MAISLASCMLWSRLSQLASSVSILSSNGWLIHLISTRRLGLAPRMIAIQNMAALILFYTLISILVLHICRKSARPNYVIGSILWDLIFTGVCIGMITVYAVAGVPADCGGLTRENWNPGDAPNTPHSGFQTVRFGHGLFGAYGELDVYCDLPKADFALAVILIFTYTLNIILSILRILSFHYIHKSEVAKLCEQAELKGKGSYSDLASLITRVSSHHVPTPHPTPPSSPAPSFHSSPITHNLHTQIPAFYSPPTSPHPRPQTSPSNSSPISPRPHTHSQLSPLPSSPTRTHPLPQIEMSDLYLSPDGEEIDMSDALVSNGSRPNSDNAHNDNAPYPPPYMPDLEANRPSGSRSSLGRYGKDQEFPGLR